ncbi:MAG: hypothetical protein CVV25_14200 [Ignavibacteriae bacterium HGW-Ignavibacteriae-4]|jgi:uncharacterized damage-inducible protein DinB|nr:hypothetical protein [Bacteroidota bacterium]PKL77597.1 MAG: hypothetical protein CVV25_14200 [Ignavibacteriae bacterium HGW-Ignavibacteriae-4]
MEQNDLKEYRYNGARSLILLHKNHLNSFLKTWREAKSFNIALPETEDSDYKSLETLLIHVLRSARGYMIWMCDKLNLADPEINTVPEIHNIDSEADEYLKHLLAKWALPLTEIEESRFNNPTYTSNWGVEYCIDAMLEHAVMHPIRHEFQLRNLMRLRQKYIL